MAKKITIGLVAVLFLVAIVGYIMNLVNTSDTFGLNLYKVTNTETKQTKKKEQKNNNYNPPKSDTTKLTARTVALSFIDSIEYYAGFSQIEGSEFNVPVPGKTVCVKEGNLGWFSADYTKDKECKSFMDAVESKTRNKAPTKATILLDENGKVQAKSKLNYYGYECIYDNSDITCN